MNRNAAFDALLAIGAALPAPCAAGLWADTDRRMKDYAKTPLPALWQIEGDSDYSGMLGQITKREVQVTWVIVHNVGRDQHAVPARATADFLDALDGALCNPVNRQTLGGLVYAAFVKGPIRRFPGDSDGIELLTVPITLLLP